MRGILSGVRVVDLTTTILGPGATVALADLGADVIKVEAPEGDIMRHQGSGPAPGMGPVHLMLNRNKRSVVLDLKDADDARSLRELVATADLFVHSMRASAIERLGLGYEAVRSIRPDIVYCFISGFGSNGPYADLPAYDDLIQGRIGLCELNAILAGEPRYTPTAIADKVVGLVASQAMLAALYHRLRSGEGQFVEVPMFESMVAFLLVEHLGARSYSDDADPGYVRLLSAARKPFATTDGFLCVLPFTDRHWRDFATLAGHAEWADDPRFGTVRARGENFELSYALMAGALRTRSNARWLEDLNRVGIPAAPVGRLADLFRDPHLQAVGLLEHGLHPIVGPILQVRPPVRYARTPAQISRPAPVLGEHTEEVLGEIGVRPGPSGT